MLKYWRDADPVSEFSNPCNSQSKYKKVLEISEKFETKVRNSKLMYLQFNSK